MGISDALMFIDKGMATKMFRDKWPKGEYLIKNKTNTLVKHYPSGASEPWFITHDDVIQRDWRIR